MPYETHEDGVKGTYLVVNLGSNYTPVIQTVLDIELLRDVLGATLHGERKQGRGKATSVAEHANALALQILAADVGKQAAQATVDTATVHVAALGRNLDTGLDAGSKALLSETHEDLLDSLVGDGGGIIHVTELSRDLSEDGVGGVGEVI